MQLKSDVLDRITFLIGAKTEIVDVSSLPALAPFDERIVAFLSDVSQELMESTEAKKYSDVITFAFWIRKGSVYNLKKRFWESDIVRLGRGLVFHISPSNVPVNFAYSLVAGLLCGNANVVRVSGKEFPQVKIIVHAFNEVLKKYKDLAKYIFCVRYEKDKEINDIFSSLADMRVVWGGNDTINELRRSPLPPRSGEVTFADRYSLAVIDSDSYLNAENKNRIAEDFYNDTFFSDQNACTSPFVIIWIGNRIEEAKKLFWGEARSFVKLKYTLQPILAVDKLTYAYMISANQEVSIPERSDNLIIRIKVETLTENLWNYRGNSGYFYEYDCRDIMELKPLIDTKGCQTIAYIGDKEIFKPLLNSGVKGIDRIVPVGRAMDFDLIWDGYDLFAALTRIIAVY